MKRKICFITGTRAEYGLLRDLILAAFKDKSIISQLIVTGTHLSKSHGLTVREIEEVISIPHILFKSKLSPKGDEHIFENISSDNNRLKLEEYVARILLQFWRGKVLLNTASNDELEEMYSDNNISPDVANKLKEKLNKFLYLIMDLSKARLIRVCGIEGHVS